MPVALTEHGLLTVVGINAQLHRVLFAGKGQHEFSGAAGVYDPFADPSLHQQLIAPVLHIVDLAVVGILLNMDYLFTL